jgi:hypothetical protein
MYHHFFRHIQQIFDVPSWYECVTCWSNVWPTSIKDHQNLFSYTI